MDHRQTEERAWERLESAFKYGDCLVTISTSGEITEQQEELTGLVPCHAYAVLDIKQIQNYRLLQVKNPWSRRPWRGKFSLHDKTTPWSEELRIGLGITSLKKFEQMEKNGIFWIEFTDVRQYFKSFFLNWNPNLFSFRTVIHDIWPVNLGPKFDSYYVGSNPQYTLVIDNANKNNNKGSMWILFSRHLTVKEQAEINAKNDENDETDYFAIHVFKYI